MNNRDEEFSSEVDSSMEMLGGVMMFAVAVSVTSLIALVITFW